MDNQTHDGAGREWAKVSEVKRDSTVMVDDAFPCVLQGAELGVFENEDNELCIHCDHGNHSLVGQLNNAGTHYIGVYHIAPPGM